MPRTTDTLYHVPMIRYATWHINLRASPPIWTMVLGAWDDGTLPLGSTVHRCLPRRWLDARCNSTQVPSTPVRWCLARRHAGVHCWCALSVGSTASKCTPCMRFAVGKYSLTRGKPLCKGDTSSDRGRASGEVVVWCEASIFAKTVRILHLADSNRVTPHPPVGIC